MPSERALALVEKTPNEVPRALQNELTRAIASRSSRHMRSREFIRIVALTGGNAAYLEITLGDDDEAHTFEFFCEDHPGELLDGALGLLVDYADGVLTEFFAASRDAYLPLEFQRRTFEGATLLVRSERRAPSLEAAADALLAGEKLDDE